MTIFDKIKKVFHTHEMRETVTYLMLDGDVGAHVKKTCACGHVEEHGSLIITKENLAEAQKLQLTRAALA